MFAILHSLVCVSVCWLLITSERDCGWISSLIMFVCVLVSAGDVACQFGRRCMSVIVCLAAIHAVM